MTNARSPRGHEYNLRPSLEWVSHPEDRLSAHPFAAANLLSEFTFGENETIDDQLKIGACTANMIDEVARYIMELLGVTPWQISRIWQYWQERNLEGTTASGRPIASTMSGVRPGATTARLGCPTPMCAGITGALPLPPLQRRRRPLLRPW